MQDETDPLLGQFPPTETAIDVRATARHVCVQVTPLRLLSKPGFHCVLAFVRDVSAQGIGLRCTGAIAPGSQVAIDWNIGQPAAHRTLRARVVHLVEGRDHVWQIGCKFETPLSDEELHALLTASAT